MFTNCLVGYPLHYSWVSLVAQLVKNLPAMQETWVESLGWEDPLEKGKATHSSILAWRIPWIAKSCNHGVAKSWTRLSDFHFHSFVTCHFKKHTDTVVHFVSWKPYPDTSFILIFCSVRGKKVIYKENENEGGRKEGS